MTSNEVRARNMAATKLAKKALKQQLDQAIQDVQATPAAPATTKPRLRVKAGSSNSSTTNNTPSISAKAGSSTTTNKFKTANPTNSAKATTNKFKTAKTGRKFKNAKRIRPPFGYPGGKFHHQKTISNLFPQHESFIDCFGGAANMVLNSDAQIRTYNDLNSEMVNLFRVIGSSNSEEYQRFITLVQQTPHSREAFEQVVSLDHELVDDPTIKAYATFVKYAQSISGNTKMWSLTSKTNGRKIGTATQKWISMSDPQRINAIRDQLATIQIENRDYRWLMETFDRSDTVIYLDPPYAPMTRNPSGCETTLYECEMTDDDHHELVDRALGIKHAHVVISGYDCAIYDRLTDAGWLKVQFKATQKISARFTDHPRDRVETIWLSPSIDRDEVLAKIERANDNSQRAGKDDIYLIA